MLNSTSKNNSSITTSITTDPYDPLTPGLRLLLGATGAGLMANCLARRTAGSVALGTLGFGLTARALSHSDWRKVIVRQTLDIDAPIGRTFAFFMHPQNYVLVSKSVTKLDVFSDGRYSKDVLIAGIPWHFEERYVRVGPESHIETRSEPSSPLRFNKRLSFQPLGEDCTRLTMHFAYEPPGGIIGHAVATILGIDAATVLGSLLLEVKAALESADHDTLAFSGQFGAKGDSAGTSAMSAFSPAH